MTTALISADNHWMLIAIMFLSTAIAICLEQKYSWAAKMSGAIITLIIAVFLVNIGIIPTSAPVFDDVVWGYAVPLAIPLLLLRTNIRKIGKDAGRNRNYNKVTRQRATNLFVYLPQIPSLKYRKSLRWILQHPVKCV